MAHEDFSPTGAPDIAASPFFKVAREIVAGQQRARDSHRSIGVRWSGLTENPPPLVETVEKVVARMEAQEQRRLNFRASPAGRFLTAIEKMEDEGYVSEANRLHILRAHFYYEGGGVPCNGEPVQIDAVAKAIQVLAPMDCKPAEEAELALADLLIAEAPRFAMAAE